MSNIISWAVLGVLVLLIVLYAASRYRTPATNQAIIVSGSTKKEDKGVKVLTSHGGFVWPIIQKATYISLQSRQITTDCEPISADKIQLHVRVIANFKVGDSDESIRLAAQRYAGQEQKMNEFMSNTVEGGIRTIVGKMNVENLLTDRQEFIKNMREVMSDSINNQGLILDTLQIQDIQDENGYIENLGKPNEAEVRRKAETAEAEAERAIETAKIDKDKQIAQSKKDLDIQNANIAEEVSKRQAEAEAAKPIAEAEQNKKKADANREVEEANVAVTQAKLKSTINAQADANKYQAITEAEAQANTTKQNANAEAEATRVRGQAEADAVKARGLAEAEAMEKKAEAYKKYNNAALQSLIIDKLPDIAKAISEPLRGAKFTAIGTDAGDKTASAMTDIAAKVPEFINTLTGVDIAKSFRNIAGDGNADDGKTISAPKHKATALEPPDPPEQKAVNPKPEAGPNA